MVRYRAIRSEHPVDGEYDYAVFREGDTSPTLEVYGRVGEGPEGVRDAYTTATFVAAFLNNHPHFGGVSIATFVAAFLNNHPHAENNNG